MYGEDMTGLSLMGMIDDEALEDSQNFEEEIPLSPLGTIAKSVFPFFSSHGRRHKSQSNPGNQTPLPFHEEQVYMEPLVSKTASDDVINNSIDRSVEEASSFQQERYDISAPQESFEWKLPETAMLHRPEEARQQLMGEDISSLAKVIQDTLRSFRVDAEVKTEDISIGPTVIRFGIRPTGKPQTRTDDKGRVQIVKDASGNILYDTRTRVSRIMALQNDLALVLEAKTIRMEAPVPGRPYVGVEIPNKHSRLVTLREILESKEYLAAKSKSKLAVALGKDVAGLVRVGDLARMPHLLIAGATGAGKSVCINTIIASILTQATPDDVRLLMVDPKMVELIMYNGIPHLLSPVVTEVEKVVPLLRNAITEMEHRYRLFSQNGVRNLDGYRKLRAEKCAEGDTSLNAIPSIVIIIDELADLMMAAPEEVEGMICRLAQLARATGIHLVVATQRPSVDVITGLIKANIPTRISFMVSSSVDSRTIIDAGGAERLLGRGDMLYLPADVGKPERIQGAFLADDEADVLADYWRNQMVLHHQAAIHKEQEQVPTEPTWELHVDEKSGEVTDELFAQAAEVVKEHERASISLLQRKLRIGHSRAAHLISMLEEQGIIGKPEVAGKSQEVYSENREEQEPGVHVSPEVANILSEEQARQKLLRRNSGQPSSLPQSRKNNHRDDIEELDL
jgi:DNA segregation ATPase FtsK/SpoIIIE-like protein